MGKNEPEKSDFWYDLASLLVVVFIALILCGVIAPIYGALFSYIGAKLFGVYL